MSNKEGSFSLGECRVCGGQGVCPECRGDSAIEYPLYGVPRVKFATESKLDSATGLYVALTPQEYAEANDPAKRAACPTCKSSGRCPCCGCRGKVKVYN